MYKAISVYEGKDTSGGTILECYSKNYGYLLGTICPHYMHNKTPLFVPATLPIPNGFFQDEMEDVALAMQYYSNQITR